MDRARQAFEAVRREWFLPPDEGGRADYDGPIPIGHGQTNSQPRTVADMLRLLDPRPGDRVLDVGAGSGWTTALLAQLVGPEGSVLGVELDPDIAAWGAQNLARFDLPWARLVPADRDRLGDPEHAPYHRILVSAEARSTPEALVDQLAEEGVLVVPVAGEMYRVVRTADGTTTTRHGHYRFVPLR